MENVKVKFEDLVSEVASKALFEALGVARPKYKGMNDKELELVLGLSESQYRHFIDKAFSRVLSDKLEQNLLDHLERGDSIEVPHSFNLFVHESEVRKNEETGEPARKVSVRTRKAFKTKLNEAQ